tara:strand:- start:46 stop:1239 length:1194 start_codon:yes stop_codon:yes gene_type:complete
MALKNNTWKLNQWYDQNVAGNISYSGAPQLWAWGKNDQGQLGQNSRTKYSSPVQIPGTNWAQLCGRGDPSGILATKTDGTLWVWGSNIGGNLGLNSQINYSSPVQVPGTTWSTTKHQLGGLYYANFAMKTDGTLWSMGYNNKGCLGLNAPETSHRSSPTQIPGTTWSTVSGGMIGYAAAATKTDGTGWVWGNNQYGSLGLNQTHANTFRSSPTQLPGTTWSRISLGDQWYSVLGRKTDGTLWSWGLGSDGELGVNNRTAYSSPVQIPGTTWTNEFVGSNKNWLAVKTDGTLWAWGENTRGALGQNQAYAQLNAASSPIQIPGTTWSQVGKLGFGACMALKTDNTLWSWGYNASGAGNLGQNQGGSAYYSSPTQIPGTDWSDIFGSTHADNAFALKNV